MRIFFGQFMPKNRRRGFTALPTLLIISGILAEIAVGVALVAFLLSSSGYGSRLSAEALIAAQAGVQDAAMRLARDKDYSTAGYSLIVGNNSANVVVETDQPITGKTRVTVTGTARVFSKRIQAIYSVNNTTGELVLESQLEVSF